MPDAGNQSLIYAQSNDKHEKKLWTQAALTRKQHEEDTSRVNTLPDQSAAISGRSLRVALGSWAARCPTVRRVQGTRRCTS